MDALARLDARLFVLLNASGRHPLLDVFLPLVTQFKLFVAPLALAWIVLFWKGDRRARVLLVFLLAGVGLSDLVASHVVKHLVARVRPCHVLPAYVYFSCKQSPSMPSSHATNFACAAVLLGACYRRWIPLFALAALVVGYSRIYVGLHYPGDVLAGYVLGAAIGGGVLFVARRAAGPRAAPGSGQR